MLDSRIGKRLKQYRETLGLTQSEFAEKAGFTVNYISTIERGTAFPRCESLISLLNTLGVSADAVFCDVLDHSPNYKSSVLSEKLSVLPSASQNCTARIRSSYEYIMNLPNFSWSKILSAPPFHTQLEFTFTNHLMHPYAKKWLQPKGKHVILIVESLSYHSFFCECFSPLIETV